MSNQMLQRQAIHRLEVLQTEIVACRKCPRLVEWRESVAGEKVKRFINDEYWGRAVPSVGDVQARLLIVGLAPAAHGANRTGRMFTGDRSGDWLYRALFKAGFSSQPESTHKDDGLVLSDCWITATCHCAPPANKPLPEEVANCKPYLIEEFRLHQNARVVLALGKIAFDAAYRILEESGVRVLTPEGKKPVRPQFGHGVEYLLTNGQVLMGSYHPSQQNTFTGKLTEPMFDAVFNRANSILNA